MRRLAPTVLFALLLAVPTAAGAFPTHCPAQFFHGDAPNLADRALATRAQEVCFGGYAVLHSGVTRTPVFSAEHLTADAVRRARGIERNDDFHPETRISPPFRAELEDYRGSGYDRGHLTPNGDLGDQDLEEESFSLANIIPQDRDNNRHLWLAIERSVRHLAERDGELWVVTGPVYLRDRPARWLHERVRVPDMLFKAVLDPRSGAAGAYVVDNAPGWQWRTVSLDELRALTGVDPFPALPPTAKAAAPQLPAPEPR